MLRVAGRELPVETLVNVDSMARRLLKDQLPGILLRTTIRAVTKSVMQDQAQKKGGVVGGLVAAVVSVATEQADERAWRTLPSRIAVARAILPRGNVALEFETGAGTHRSEVTIGNRFTIIPIRLTGGAVYVGQPEVGLYDKLPDAKPSTNVRGDGKSKRPRKKANPASVVQ